MGKLFWGITNVSFCCFMMAINFSSNFIGECQCKYAVCFKMKSRDRIQFNNQVPQNKHHDWFALVKKYLCGKIMQTSLKLTIIRPINDCFIIPKTLLHHCALPYSVHFLKSSRTNCPSWQQTLIHLELFTDYVRGRYQTESLTRLGGPESWLRQQPTGFSHNKAHIAHTYIS